MSWRFAVNAQDSVAQEFGWGFNGLNSNGHRTYSWNAPNGTQHMVVGYGDHQGDPTQDAKKLRKLMQSCQNGTCAHINLPPEVPLTDEPGAPVIRPGTQVSYGNGRWWVMDVDGGLAHIYDAAGQEDIVPEQELKVAHVPDWVFTSHVVRRSQMTPWAAPPESWVSPVVRPGGWSTFKDTNERDVCPFCGGSMTDANHSHDYCKVVHRRVAGREWEELPRYQEQPDCPHCHRDALHFQYDEEGRPYLECAACQHEFMQDSGNGQLHDMTRGGGDWQAMPEFPEPTGETVPNFMPADWA